MNHISFKQEFIKESPTKSCFSASLATAIALKNGRVSQEIYLQIEKKLLQVRDIATTNGEPLIDIQGNFNTRTAHYFLEESNQLLNHFLEEFGTQSEIQTQTDPDFILRNLQTNHLMILGCVILGDNSDDAHAIVLKHAMGNIFSVYDANAGGVQAVTSKDIYRGILPLKDSGYVVQLNPFSITI